MAIELEFGGLKLEVEVTGWQGVVTLAGLGLLGAAVASELSRPPRERAWHGALAGLVPYDLRPPTFERLRERLWNPAEPRLLVPTAFGVGWTVNLARLLAPAPRAS